MKQIINNCNNDKIMLSFSDTKHITWEIESRCMMNCSYCYPNRTRKGNLKKERIDQIINQINDSDIEYIHITGGEPTLNKYLEYIIMKLQGNKIYITTNLAENLDIIKGMISRYEVYSIAISLDSTNPKINNYLRGKTEEVMRNIVELLSYRQSMNLKTKIRIHCVLNKKNLDEITNLLIWSRKIGIDEVSCQPISISKNHKCYNELVLKYSDLEKIQFILDIEYRMFNSRYAYNHLLLLKYYLKNPECYLEKNDLCSIFVDANGIIWNCPRKKHQLSFITDRFEVDKCNITPQCMTCLKHLCIKE